ncbi:MAG: glycosyltransferase, partial [Ktedonobacteraceae bacterium]
EPDIVIVLMGEGEEAELRALIASEDIGGRVKIIPPVPNYTELLDWTASADIGLILYTPSVSLSVKFILPNKLFEYIMAGIPVLATQLDAVAEVIRTYDVGQIVSSATPASIGAAINAMLADPIALDRMRCNALRASQGELHWEEESRHLVRFYHDILKAGRAKRVVQRSSSDGDSPSAKLSSSGNQKSSS